MSKAEDEKGPPFLPRRRLFMIASAISLLLCLATAALWVRSYSSSDAFGYSMQPKASLGPWRAWEVVNCLGSVQYREWTTASRAAPDTSPGWYCSTAIERTSLSSSARYLGWKGNVQFGSFLGITCLNFDATVRGEHIRQLRAFGIPHWMVVLVLASLPAWQACSMLRSRQRLGRCVACGYDLRATPEKCPECGLVPETMKAER